jgi:hypothetical protein
MTVLDVNKLHRRGALLEGAVTTLAGNDPRRPLPPSGRNYDDLVAGVGVLHWRDQEIEWVQLPIIERNPPRSWGSNPHRWRPLFVCDCAARAVRLHLMRDAGGGQRFACAACSGYRRPSRVDRDPFASDFRRLAKLRAQLGVRGLTDDPNVSKPRAPRSIMVWRRRVRQLRELELRIAQRLDGVWSERLFGRPPRH